MPAVILACLVFCVGLYGVLARREIVAVLASVEVMLGGATLLLVMLAATYQPFGALVLAPGATPGAAASVVAPAAAGGQAVALLLLAIIASEAAVGLALLVALVKRGRTRMSEIAEVRG